MPIDAVNVWYFAVRFPRRLHYAPAMANALAGRCQAFDVIHLHSVFLWPTWMAARLAHGHGIPYLVSPRGMLVKDLIARKSTLAKRCWIKLIEQRTLEAASAIHVTSAVEANELGRFGFSLPPVYEIPHGVGDSPEEHAYGELADPPAVAATLSAGRPVILALGRINWKKGLDRVVGALQQLPDALLLIVGNDEDGYLRTLGELAGRLGVTEQVAFAGPVFGSAKAELYRRATLMVLASHSENFGNVVLEAMLEGCPVVVTPEVGASAIVGELGAGLVVSGDSESLARAFRRLIDDEKMRKEMGVRGREGVRARYTWDAAAERVAGVYRRLVDSRLKIDTLGAGQA